MHPDLVTILLPGALVLFAASTLVSQTQERDRSKIPDEYKWDLTAVYPSDQAWRTAKEKLVDDLPKLRQFQGKLAPSASTLADALDMQSHFDKELSRLYVYAAMSSDQDTRVSLYQGMQQEMVQLGSVFGTESAFIEPEILKMDNTTVEHFLAQEPRLKIYRHYLEDIARRRAHTLSNNEEKLLAGASVMASGPRSVFGIFADADFPYPSVTLTDGKTVVLDKATFSLQRASGSREDRQKVMEAFFTALGKYRATFGSMMNSNVQTSVFYAHARHYDTSLASSLDEPNIPVSVYSRLVEGVNRNLPTFHRYLKLRKRMMGVPELHYYDLYAPLVPSVDTKYSVDAAEHNILAALAPLGPEYASGAQRAFKERWIDIYPTEGKRAGAYSNGGAYDVHPYMLLNYNGKYDDMSTLAHELGHTMHSYFSNKTQPYPLADYPIFVAEVASTFNEALLMDYMLKNIQDDATRLSLLGNYLESIKGTVFRQTQFAEFELRMHEMVEKGQPLTGDALSKLYGEIVKKYYGHDQGVCVVDAYIANEWAFIPHFYSSYYVFQYATSFTASSALSEKVLSGDPGATQRYLHFISSGKSKYPIELLKDAGVDMTTDEPLELTVQKMNRVMDEMEKLLDKKRTTAPGN
ncbi:MAG TPA: oligoendopeptidase F [Candidatus Sulfotelmatobacter sp.]|nr:oligoendopeptidase F [Candidatus Sulfotelmatobacter sp.]